LVGAAEGAGFVSVGLMGSGVEGFVGTVSSVRVGTSEVLVEAIHVPCAGSLFEHPSRNEDRAAAPPKAVVMRRKSLRLRIELESGFAIVYFLLKRSIHANNTASLSRKRDYTA
jgi:hypothetical protein